MIVYTISTNISGMKGKGDKVLERIADATGGRAFFPFQMRDVSDAFLSIQEELRSQYAVAYKPANFVADGRYRTIEILAPGKGLESAHAQGLLRSETVSQQTACQLQFVSSQIVNSRSKRQFMAGYSGTPLPKKLGIKDGFRVALLHVPADVKAELRDALGIVPDSEAGRARNLDFIFLFAKSRAALDLDLRTAAKALAPAGMLWISWPKKSSGVATDLDRKRDSRDRDSMPDWSTSKSARSPTSGRD